MGEQRPKRYRWSSYPWYLNCAGKKPAWLHWERVLGSLGLSEKGSPQKLVLAWWLRENTTVTLRWVSKRLEMGHYTRVTQAISRMSRRPGRKLEKIKRQLRAIEAAQRPNACE